ncbi:UvrD-helicase domain-containing protein [Thermosyntropha sp.]|uniref:ATP-dependent helicase n=1 Tax=Thermosyntropha sp. TaxID=2740820 RepID=UPI0025F2242E|nr:UvrD-helicase domain-containing protein [Thermosyntropha sp.]MBO8158758.1 UvrD-helicase domain-containing protein [Thermosyntropha sp.]
MLEIQENLNKQQRQAVIHKEGPCMVLAGAGSGKTKVLTCRIANLIDEGVHPNSILAITFTNKAAEEMRTRIAGMIPDYTGQWIQTFHAACYKILKMDIEPLGYNKNFSIMDESDVKSLLKEMLKAEKDYETKPENLLYHFKQIKNKLIKPEDYFKNLSCPEGEKEKYYRLFKLYNLRLKELNALDFDDLIFLCIRLFRENPDVLAKYQKWFKYIMIDEYQDTNYAQYIWANLLASEHRNIFVVGDPDQSIYSWRGAEPYNIKRFLKDYPEAVMIKLEQNYRSTRYILEAANAVIRHNEDREEKNLYTTRKEGEKIIHFCARDSFQEARFIADTIAELAAKENRKYSDFAILYRTHAQSRALEEALLAKYIPYHIVGAYKFYQRKEIKDIIAYLKLACNPNDILSFRRIINVPRRGIGEKTLNKIERYAMEKNLPVLEALADCSAVPGISQKMVGVLEEFFGMVKFFAGLNESGASITEILDNVMEMTGYVEDLRHNDPKGAEVRIDNLKELRSLAVEFEREEGGRLEEFLAKIALVQDADEMDYKDAVFLMTYHGAKGLEFPVVFMTGMEEGVFPSYRCETPEEMEEERRICYVGITRAMEKLYLTNAVTRLLYGYERSNPPSRFLKEIPPELICTPEERRAFMNSKLAEGDKVRHSKFGIGVVTGFMDDGQIGIIDFAHVGTKMLRLDIAPLEKIG